MSSYREAVKIHNQGWIHDACNMNTMLLRYLPLEGYSVDGVECMSMIDKKSDGGWSTTELWRSAENNRDYVIRDYTSAMNYLFLEYHRRIDMSNTTLVTSVTCNITLTYLTFKALLLHRLPDS